MAEVVRSGILIANGEGKITFANNSWYDITGIPYDQDPNDFMNHVHPDDCDLVAQVCILELLYYFAGLLTCS